MSAVAGRSSTLSKCPELFPESYPKYLVSAKGAEVRGESYDRHYTDWIAGLLSVILGYCEDDVVHEVVHHLQVEGGPTWSLPHKLEEEVAGTVRRLAGYPDGQVRFVKTGSEACSAAVRIARAVTGKRWIMSSGYHGWHSDLLGTPPRWGITANQRADLYTVQYGEKIADGPINFGGIAAVIVEPETLEPANAHWLSSLRDWCDNCGTLLVFDECITGGRYPQFTAGRHYTVHPDLTVLSKCLANGWPLACVVGERTTMRCFDVDWHPEWDESSAQGPVYVSGTYSGETASLAAARATLAIWERDNVGRYLYETGRWFKEQLASALSAARQSSQLSLKGPGYRLALEGHPAVRTALMQQMAQRGHLIGTGFNLMAAHGPKELDSAIDAFADSLKHLDEPAGRPVVQPYRQG